MSQHSSAYQVLHSTYSDVFTKFLDLSARFPNDMHAFSAICIFLISIGFCCAMLSSPYSNFNVCVQSPMAAHQPLKQGPESCQAVRAQIGCEMRPAAGANAVSETQHDGMAWRNNNQNKGHICSAKESTQSTFSGVNRSKRFCTLILYPKSRFMDNIMHCSIEHYHH